MNFIRAVFIFAIVMLAVGLIGSRMWLESAFNPQPVPIPTAAVASQAPTDTPAPAPTVPAVRHHTSAHRATSTAGPTATPSPHPTMIPGVTRIAATSLPALHPSSHPSRVAPPHPNRHLRRSHRPVRPAAHPTPTATALPTPSPTTGTVALTSYWVNQSVARDGRTIALGYVIDNGTGQTMRIMLGASLKSSRTLSWAAQSVNDPYHDVVAVVPPGVSTHIRYFTLPSGVRPGHYDVAWGLRNAASGIREGLVAAPSALQIVR